MSRSKKRPIVKDNGIGKRFYHRAVRRVQKAAVRAGQDIPDRRTIINDYDYCDYIFNYEAFKAKNGRWSSREVGEQESLSRHCRK